MELGTVVEEDAGDRHGGGGSAERGDGDAGFETADQLFQDEDRAGDRRVECGGEACACAGGDEDAAIGPVAAECFSDEVGEAGAHLHAGTFAAEGEAGADREDAADEFYGDQPEGRGRELFVEHGFDVGDAAAGRARGEASDEPGGQGGGGGAGSDDD